CAASSARRVTRRPDERVALAGDDRPLLGLLAEIDVGTLFLEVATPRAGEIEVLKALPGHLRLGVGVLNQKREPVESADEALARARRAVDIFGAERVLLTPDGGFATFADILRRSVEVSSRGRRPVPAFSFLLGRYRGRAPGLGSRPSASRP